MMKNFNLFFLAILIVFSFSAVKAQQTEPPPNAPNGKSAVNKNRRADVLEQLDLTPEQLRQYRRVNAENRPAMRAAQQRLKEANRALDQAVYADAPDDADVQMRIKEAQTAQSEVIRLRTLTELAVRRILTGEQLTKFREARRRFEAAIEERRADKTESRMLNAPNRRPANRRRALQPND